MSQDFNCQEALLQCKATEDITGKDGLAQKIIKFQILQTKSPRRQRTGTAGRWTAFTRLYSLMPCILKYVKKGGS